MEDRVLSQTDVEQQPELPLPEPDRVTVEEPSFAHLLQHLREVRGLSKADLAKRAGVDPSSITRPWPTRRLLP